MRNGVDETRFPTEQNGWYLFHGIADFTNRSSHCLAKSPGKTTLVCFDVACLLLKSVGCGADRLYDDFDSKGIIEVTPERTIGPVVDERFRASTGLLFPANGYESLVGKPRSEAETRLGLSLRASRTLSADATDSDQGLRAVFATYVRAVERDGFVFPKDFKVGMVFYVDFKRHFFKADHAFICIPKAGRLMSIEKTGPTGPYVRGEFESEDDLALYASFAERRDTNNPEDCDYGSTVIVSLNDRVVGIYRPDSHQ